MKKIFYLIILIAITFYAPNKVNAYCDDQEIIRLQNIAKNVRVNYTFDEKKEKFVITFTNLTKELIVYDATNYKEYNVFGELNLSGSYYGNNKFDIYAKKTNCTKDVLTTKYIKLPFYNQYYKYDECKDINEHAYCSKWLSKELDYLSWRDEVIEYKESLKKNENKQQEKIELSLGQKILDFLKNVYVKYYYIILPTIITILCIIIYIKNKEDSFF